ncbi:MAG: glycosyltransferase family 4 protein [Tardiphaga sp.]|uniref:glycosyltransferase family 4 protein n=1 Tax=Tardiphaga sp. TaxID=1926292 RepID=UPI0019BE4812|nr:glycosyltransferase family 4 protein [Tardiphaga sp.]MBC7585837.1 glycosyltransferase family 4 protein [Tardiphaga sp.]
MTLPSVRSGKPRVLFIQTQGENAGAQEITRLLGAGLTARGFDVHHLFFYRKSAHFNEPPNTLYCTPGRPKNPVAAMRFLATLGQRIRQLRPDVILPFQHYGNTVGGAVARLVSAAPIIANQVSPKATMNPMVRAVDFALGNLAFFKSIVVNSHDMLVDYSRYPRPYRSRLRYIPHGFELKRTTLSKQEARRAFNLPPDAILLGGVARLHPIKRLDKGIQALVDHPEWHLAVAGQGPEEANLKRLAEQLGLGIRVHFIGEIAPERIGDFLVGLDVFVFPSESETFGLAAVEAAGAGIPTVVTDLAVLREVLSYKGEPAALFVDAADARQLAAGVARLLTDDVLRETLQRSAAGLTVRYSIDAMTDEYVRLMGELGVSA